MIWMYVRLIMGQIQCRLREVAAGELGGTDRRDAGEWLSGNERTPTAKRQLRCQAVPLPAALYILLLLIAMRPVRCGNCFRGEYLWYGPKGEVRVANNSDAEVTAMSSKTILYGKGAHCKDRPALEFVPHGCSLTPLTTQAFVSSLRGRRLIIWGDSVSRQLFHYLTRRSVTGKDKQQGFEPVYKRHPDCKYMKTSLMSPVKDGTRAAKRAVERHAWSRMSRECFEVYDDVDRHCYEMDGSGAKVCYVLAWDNVITTHNVAVFNSLREDDIVLANVGLHHNGALETREGMMNFRLFLQDAAKANRTLPQFIWRTTSAQHFAQSPGGLYPLDKQQARALKHAPPKYRCQGYRYSEMKAHNLRNMEARAALYGLDIPVLDVWNVTALMPDAHPQLLNDRVKADCTHFCGNPGGMYEVWLHLLQNLLTEKVSGPTRSPFPFYL